MNSLLPQAITGTDSNSTTASRNTATGDFTIAAGGTDNYSNGITTGSNAFTSTEAGNAISGAVSLSQTGTDRYGLLYQFNNTSDGANGGGGLADFSPVGLPIGVGQENLPAAVSASIPTQPVVNPPQG